MQNKCNAFRNILYRAWIEYVMIAPQANVPARFSKADFPTMFTALEQKV